MRTLSLAAVVVCALAAAPQVAQATANQAPKVWLMGLVEQAKELAARKQGKSAKSKERWKSEIKAVVDEILDWDELSRRALGRQYKKLKDAERKEFGELLRAMIEASYQSKLSLNTGKDNKRGRVSIEWLDEKITGDKAKATARVKSGKSEVVLEFRMLSNKKQWRVYDVSIDDVSTVRTYRSQFRKIISRDGFPALLTRLRTKTEEIRSGRADVSSLKSVDK